MTITAVNNLVEYPEYSYHLLRCALDKFQKNIPQLTEEEYQKVQRIADRTFSLEAIVLSSPEARDVVIPDSKLDESVKEVASRYTDHEAFLIDLKNNGLDEITLRNALYRELMFDAVIARVTAKTPDVSDIDIQIFYQLHKDRFTKPERRKARHILITINPEFVENERESAFRRSAAIAEKLRSSPSRFEALARKHSECPTAMDGGRLGDVVQGTLYPELDTELFSMHEGEVSHVIETEIGFHILLCEKINRAVTIPIKRARERIRLILQERQRKACQKAWLDKLEKESHD